MSEGVVIYDHVECPKCGNRIVAVHRTEPEKPFTVSVEIPELNHTAGCSIGCPLYENWDSGTNDTNGNRCKGGFGRRIKGLGCVYPGPGCPRYRESEIDVRVRDVAEWTREMPTEPLWNDGDMLLFHHYWHDEMGRRFQEKFTRIVYKHDDDWKVFDATKRQQNLSRYYKQGYRVYSIPIWMPEAPEVNND